MENVNVNVRLDAGTVAFLDELARVQDRDRSYLIKQAVAQYVSLQRWQVEEIEKAVTEADAGDFVPEEEMERLFQKWTR